jgi:prepilin-type N-terminal cleavage/methylation domain-containing protein
MKSSKKGFTLIELLVVISIIAILMSILMPALSKVREQAKALVCGTRQKSLGQAMMSYESETGKMPMNSLISAGVMGPAAVDMRWFNLIAPYVGREDVNSAARRENIASDYELFRCPTQDYLTKLYKEWDGVSDIISPKTGNKLHATGTQTGIYGYNIYFRQYNSNAEKPAGEVYKYSKSSQVKLPSELPMLADLAAEAPGFSPANNMASGGEMGVNMPHPIAYDYGWEKSGRNPTNWNLYGPAANHKCDKITYTFADGHTEAMNNLWPWFDKDDLTASRREYFHPQRLDK